MDAGARGTADRTGGEGVGKLQSFSVPWTGDMQRTGRSSYVRAAFFVAFFFAAPFFAVHLDVPYDARSSLCDVLLG